MTVRITTTILIAGFLFVGLRARAIAQTNGTQSEAQPIPASTDAGRFFSFDPVGSQSTRPTGINVLGAITGYYYDVTGTAHGFLRDPNGRIITFDGPDSARDLGLSGTVPAAVNDFGSVAGSYYDASGQHHGFVRLNDCPVNRPKNCTLTTFDVPSAAGGTNPTDINLQGAITGYYYDANYAVHGFERAPDGDLTFFDVPGAGNTAGQGTMPTGINLRGAIAGNFSYPSATANGVKPNLWIPPIFSGFLRNPEGKITTFAPPTATSIGVQVAINLTGAVAGYYWAGGGIARGFVRESNGTYSTFDGANYLPCCISTYPTSINDLGAVTGSYNDGLFINHGFVRTSYGVITSFDAPGASQTIYQGTLPVAINLDGAITGSYLDANSVSHGFVRLGN